MTLDKEQMDNWDGWVEDKKYHEYPEKQEVQLEMDFEGMRGDRDERDKTPMQMVQEYVKVSGQEPDVEMSMNLIEEEWIEWRSECFMGGPTHELKELSDLVYVIYGYANARGWDLDMALLRVHDNNMGRMYQPDGTISRRDDGKILRNKAYPSVDLKDLV